MFQALKSGFWLNWPRLRAYSFILILFYILGLLAWVVTAHGLLDWKNRPIGTDFSQVWVSGGMVLAGHPELPFNNDALFAAEQAAFGPETALFAWGYPPFFLGLAALLALFPYLWALVLWQVGSGLAYLWTMCKIVPRRETWLLALAYPAVFVNITHGHNGFLTASLMAGGLLCLQRAPVMSGLLFAALVYKPQYGLLVPLALAFGGSWRVAFSAAFATIGLTLATLALWGTAPWLAFVHSLTFSRVELLEQGNTGFYKLQSLFTAVRMAGGSVTLAYSAQAVLGAALAVSIAWLWRSKADMRLKSAGLCVAAILATPYCFDYDMVILAPAVAFLVSYSLEKGFIAYEKTAIFIIALSPLLARGLAQATLVPFGWLCMMALLGLILLRAREE
eukprot:gene2506-2545_t